MFVYLYMDLSIMRPHPSGTHRLSCAWMYGMSRAKKNIRQNYADIYLKYNKILAEYSFWPCVDQETDIVPKRHMCYIGVTD